MSDKSKMTRDPPNSNTMAIFSAQDLRFSDKSDFSDMDYLSKTSIAELQYVSASRELLKTVTDVLWLFKVVVLAICNPSANCP